MTDKPVETSSIDDCIDQFSTIDVKPGTVAQALTDIQSVLSTYEGTIPTPIRTQLDRYTHSLAEVVDEGNPITADDIARLNQDWNGLRDLIVYALGETQAREQAEERVAQLEQTISAQHRQLSDKAYDSLMSWETPHGRDGFLKAEDGKTESVVRMQEAHQEQQGYAIAYLDLDFFTEINTTYGHARGDHVLNQVAHVIRQSVSKQDLLIRKGGEELVLFLQDVTKEDAKNIMERVITKIREHSFPLEEGDAHTQQIADQGTTYVTQGTLAYKGLPADFIQQEEAKGLVRDIYHLTASAGIVHSEDIHAQRAQQKTDFTQPEHVKKLYDSLLALSDKALYKAKSQRNSVAVYKD